MYVEKDLLSQNSELLPKVKEYIEKCLFDVQVDIKNPEVVKKLNPLHIRSKIKEVFVDALNKLSKIEEEYKIPKYYRVSESETIHTSQSVYKAKKTVFDFMPYSSEYERDFMEYLDEQNEVLVYTKVLPRFPLHIPYYNQEGFLRHYIPDFIIKTKSGFYLLETKGAGFEEMESAKLKAKAAANGAKMFLS